MRRLHRKPNTGPFKRRLRAGAAPPAPPPDTAATLPVDEASRLDALRGYAILDTAPELAFDDITRLAAHLCGAPIALISLVESDRQWFKSRVGLDVCQTGRDASFCAHALGGRELFVIPDAWQDLRFAGNPLVIGEPHIRFYAGVPLNTPEGHTLGTLCVIDRVPRTLTPDQEEALLSLGRQVMSQMALRRSNAALQSSEARNGALLQASLDCIISMDAGGRITEWNPAAERTFGHTRAEALGQELSALIIPERLRGAHNHGLAHYLASGEGPVLNRRVEVPALRRDGSEFDAELTAIPIREGGRTSFTAYLRDIGDRKRAEEALQEQHNLLQAVIEGIDDAIYVKDLAGRYVVINTAGARSLGRPVGDIIGKDDTEISPAEDARRTQAHDRRVLAVGRTQSYEDTETGGRGTRTFLSSKGVYRNTKGEIAGLFGLSHDITTRKCMEEALRASEERFRLLAESGSDIISILALDGTIRYESQSVQTILGYRPDELVGQNCFHLLHPDDMAATARVFTRLVETGVPEPTRFRFRHREGHWRHLEALGRLVEFEGAPAVLVNSRDVTARHQAEEALQRAHEDLCGANGALERRVGERTQALARAEAKYRSIFENAVEGIFQTSPEGRYLNANPALARLCGYDTPERLMAQLTDIEHSLYVDPDRRAEFARRMREQGSVTGFESQVRRCDGGVIWISEAARCVPDADGRLQYYEGTVKDISERKRAEADLRESEQRYRGLVESCPEAVVVYAQGRLVYVNDAAVALLGAARADELLDRPVMDLIHPEFHGFARERVRRSQEEGKASPLAEQRYVRLDGREIDVEAVSSPITYRGQPAGQVLIRDITERKRAQQRISNLNGELVRAYDATIEGWSRALDLRDKETEGHCRRVTEMTLHLAETMGVDGEELIQLRRGALLHDIGKMGVPDHILLKPGPLTDDEWVIMRRHPSLAHEMLSPIAFLRPALDIPLRHHEKWDGTGYPNGLGGDEIPLAARLFAVVDVWDALRSDRPYRAGWPEARVLTHIQSLSGTHFDPSVVRAFLSLTTSQERETEAPLLRAA